GQLLPSHLLEPRLCAVHELVHLQHQVEDLAHALVCCECAHQHVDLAEQLLGVVHDLAGSHG
ncbi:hypothetical protein, partial [Citrobacter youngae]|uniref:hypothetical protein n=1 Tax=Citrobacter youngae TaxID=133448 RepID=UPI001954574E